MSRVIAQKGLNLKFHKGIIVDSTSSIKQPLTGLYNVKFFKNKSYEVFAPNGSFLGKGIIEKTFKCDDFSFRLIKIVKWIRDSFTFKVKNPHIQRIRFST